MAKKLSASVGSYDPIYDFSGPMFNLYGTPRDETDEEKSRRLGNRSLTLAEAAGRFAPDYNSPSDPYRSMNYMAIADTASALGIPMPEPVAGAGNMYGQQQAADFVASNPVPNRLGVQAMSPQAALAMRIRQAQAARAIPGSADILSPRSFAPQGIPQSTYFAGRDVEPGILNYLRAMLGY